MVYYPYYYTCLSLFIFWHKLVFKLIRIMFVLQVNLMLQMLELSVCESDFAHLFPISLMPQEKRDVLILINLSASQTHIRLVPPQAALLTAELSQKGRNWSSKQERNRETNSQLETGNRHNGWQTGKWKKMSETTTTTKIWDGQKKQWFTLLWLNEKWIKETEWHRKQG